MSANEGLGFELRCVNHRNRSTGVRCGKCGDPICPRCMIQTPVGARCKQCAGLRRLPQYDVDAWLLLRAVGAGLLISLAAWFLLSYVVYLRFFLSILVGVAVGEGMSRLAKRRSNRLLESGAVAVVLAGLIIVESVRYGGISGLGHALAYSPGAQVGIVLPGIVASLVAVVKLR